MKHNVNEYLIALHAKHGTLTPDIVVEDARRKDSPLHDLFEWDTKKAALAHWQDTARQLIRSVRVNITHESRVIRAPYFVRDPECDTKTQGYTTVDRVRGSADLARDVIADECARAAAAFKRAQDVAIAVGVEQDVADLLTQTLDLGNRMAGTVESS